MARSYDDPLPPMQTIEYLRQQSDFPLHHVPVADGFAPDTGDGNRVADTQDMDCQQTPMPIGEALREHCSISARRFFVAAIMNDGTPVIFSGPGNASADGDVVRQFFDLDRYQKVMEYQDLVVEKSFGLEGGFHKQSIGFTGNPTCRYRHPLNWHGSDIPEGDRKRRRVSDDDQADSSGVSTTRKGIKIGSSEDVWKFYEQRFSDCQQAACTLIAKAWVKAVEPKKQSTHPYKGSDEKAPEWWPKPWGPTKERVRHKEPDHLYKRERLRLLNHILRMVVEPWEKQHADIQKQNLNVKKLEEVATEALSAFFADEANAKKRPYLSEIFKVAKQEERFKKEEIDGTTKVYVMAGDKIPETYSENDDDDQDICDDDRDISATKPSTARSSMSPKLDLSSSTALHGTPFPVDLPVRGTQYTPMIPGTTPEQRGFVNGNRTPNSDQSSVHQTGRKYASDNLAATSQYSSQRTSTPGPSTNLSGQTDEYFHYQQWPSSCTSTQQTDPPEANLGSLDAAHTGHSIDGLPRHHSTEMFQAGGVLQQSVQSSWGGDFRSHCGW